VVSSTGVGRGGVVVVPTPSLHGGGVLKWDEQVGDSSEYSYSPSY
jgi:hypothetical protein